MDNMRKIIHIDMDAFFAQIEQRDHPEYKNKPLIVGGPLNRGVISTASYEARKYGLCSGMPLSRAKKLCPEGIYIPVNMEKYLRESEKIKEIFFQFTPLVESMGCDEAFLDVTGCQKLFGNELEIAKKIKGKIYEKTNLTSSAGIGPNKFLAKLASNIGKPNGFTVFENTEEVLRKIQLMPVSYLWGVGKVTENELKSMGIETIGELASTPLAVLDEKFGEPGRVIHKMANGIDNRKVEPNREPESIGREVTFSKDVDDYETLRSTLLILSQKIYRNLRMKKYKGRVITLKVRYSDFKTITTRKTLKKYTSSIFEIYRSAITLLDNLDLKRKKIRLVGIYAGDLKPVSMLPGYLFYPDESKDENLAIAIDKISDKFGEDKLTIAKLIEQNRIK
ncbi:MAG: DNA polymerase IV [Actinomycetota bacterium]|nr:DNA polymerase IV [Actinomycetota bacterium]